MGRRAEKTGGLKCVMLRRTGTSAPCSFPVRLLAANTPEITFSFFIFEPPVAHGADEVEGFLCFWLTT